MKIPLTSTRVDRFARSCENIVPRFQTSSILPPSPPETPELFPNSIEETLLQPVLKSFVTAFIQRNIDLVNKLTRAPLLGLARSILGQISLAFLTCLPL